MKSIKTYLALALTLLICAACGPPELEKFVEVKPNETAFLVPMEGANKSSQKKFMSLDYLNSPQVKVPTKRINIPLRKLKTGYLWFDYKYIPTMMVITVDRTPVTREWTKASDSGTSRNNEAIAVESQDSIGFKVGVNITASVLEEDAALFLYRFAGKPLSNVIDSNIRGYVQIILSEEFGVLELGGNTGKKAEGEETVKVRTCRNAKAEIAQLAYAKASKHFKDMGITIESLGLAEGLLYNDAEIQVAINNAFKEEMNIEVKRNQKLGQIEVNSMNESIAISEKVQALEFAKASDARIEQVRLKIEEMRAQAYLNASKRWNGGVPSKILPQGSSFLFELSDSK